MSFMFLPDFIKHAVASAPGTGNATLGSVIPGFQSLANTPNAPASGSVVPYMFSDSGSKWERGYGTLTLSGSTWTLARTQVIESSAGLATAENLSSAAQFWISIFAEDILNRTNKNVLRNPGMDIAQRGTSGSISAASSGYTLDGWIIAATGAAAAWSQQYSVNIAGNALRISAASGLTDVKLSQRIESSIAARLLTALKGAQPVTIQAIISNQTAAAITPNFSAGYASARDNFGTVTADISATAMQSIPAGGTGQVALCFVPNTSLTNGYQVTFDFGSALNASSGYIDISLADLRVSPGIGIGVAASAPSPERRLVGQDLAFCQRYLEKSYAQATSPGTPVTAGTGGIFLGTSAVSPFMGISVKFKVQMRSAPTVTIFDNGGNAGKVSAFISSLWTNGEGLAFNIINDSGFSCFLNNVANASQFSFDYIAGAEL